VSAPLAQQSADAADDRQRPELAAQQVLQHVPGCRRYSLVRLLAARGRTASHLTWSIPRDQYYSWY